MSRDAQIAARVLEMRVPLSRVELAASQLLRGGQSPASRALVKTIRLAVEELDAQIERSLLVLAGPLATREVEDCADVPGEVLRRLAPVVTARGVVCRLGEAPGAPVPGDPERLRRGAVALLRGGARWARDGGRIELSIAGEKAGIALRLQVDRDAEATDPAAPAWPCEGARTAETAFADAQDLALADGADLELRAMGALGLHATLLFRQVGA